MFRPLLLVLLIPLSANADQFGLRLDSALPGNSSAIVQFPPGGQPNGKMIHLVYDWEPHANFYVEGGAGYRSWDDIFEYSSLAFEVSPGFRVTAGYFVMKFSEGAAFMPMNHYDPATKVGYQQWDFVTHLTFGFRDPKTGIGIYVDRSHYSNGYSIDNPSLNYTGFSILFPIGKVK